MAGALVQSTNIGAAASVYGRSSHNSKRTGAVKRMLCNASSVQMRGGLRISAQSLSLRRRGGGFNALEEYFQPKVVMSVSAPCGRGSRCVASATLRYTDEAVRVCKLAKEEAERMGHKYFGTEEIFLAIIAEETCIAANVLKSMGISLKGAQVEMDRIIETEDWIVSPSEFQMPRFIMHLRREVFKLGHDYISPEHMLLALLNKNFYVASHVLENLGVDTNNIRTQVIHMISESTEAAA